MSVLSNIRRNIFEPLHAAYSGSPLVAHWKLLEYSQFLSESDLKIIQSGKLKDLIEYVWKHNEFYRERFTKSGLSQVAEFSLDDFLKIPVLSKEDIRYNTHAMISQGFDLQKLLNFKTGGSTGRSLDIHITEECSEFRNACARRHDRWSGWEVGEPIAAVWGNPDYPSTLRAKLKEWLLSPLIYLDTMDVSRASVLAFAQEWKRVKPTLLFGHAHSIFILAQFVEEIGLDTIQPRAIISSSMMLMHHERQLIERVFGVPVTDRYGCEEVSLIASECEMHDGMHLNIDHLFIEFLDDNDIPVKPGDPGKIVVTDLMNRAMPLIRYRIEDIGVPTERKCACGRGLPLMESISGRTADFLIKKGGSRVAGISMIENTLTKYPGLDQMQIVQNDFEDFTIRIVPGKGYCDDVLSSLSDSMKKVFGDEIVIRYETIPAIPPEKSGKYRFSICRIE